MSPLFIWGAAALLYLIFFLWYVGLGRKIKPQEIDTAIEFIKANADPSEELLQTLRHFSENDDGKDFVMVNLLELKQPIRESRKKLMAYQKTFLSKLLRRAGHPVFVATIASGKIENIACNDDNWRAAGMVRYRSRRDLLETICETAGSAHHALKLESLERTFAYPAAPWTITGGPKIIVPLVLALIAALIHLATI